MDHPSYVELVPSRGSISSNQVSRVFSAQVELTTSTCHRVLASALLDSGANSCFMDREFALSQNILLNKLPSPVAVGVIDGRPIASGDIVEESKPIRIVLGDLASIISFNIIRSPEHPLVLGLPWFELHNPKIDWMKRTIEESQKKRIELASLKSPPLDTRSHMISTISLRQLYKEGGNKDMLVFAILPIPSSILQNSDVQLPKKYKEFSNVFDKSIGMFFFHETRGALSCTPICLIWHGKPVLRSPST